VVVSGGGCTGVRAAISARQMGGRGTLIKIRGVSWTAPLLNQNIGFYRGSETVSGKALAQYR